jgi:DNA-binding CsgD family transcriptional regulator
MFHDPVGRREEVSALEELVAAPAALPRTLLIEGEVGIGKSTLWRTGLRLARERSYRVLTASPGRSEASLSFATLTDLLEDALTPERLSALAAPLSRALEMALLRVSRGGEPVEPRALAMAVRDVLRALAYEGPVLVAIDDVQWLDPPSGTALEFACRRLREAPVAILLTRRTGGDDATGELLEALPADFVSRLELGPLSLGATHELLRRSLAATFPRPTLRRLHEASAGNPLFSIEIARALQAGAVRPMPGEPLPLPGGLQALVRKRLADLPPALAEPLLAAAALSDASLATIEAALSREVRDDLRPAVDAGVIELDDERVRFTHPLLASTTYASADAGRRRALHGRLAAALSDPEEHSRHLALSLEAPDADAAQAIEQAAETVAARGAPQAAAELCEQALRLTGSGQSEDASRRRVAAGWYHFVAGDATRARELLESAVERAPAGPAHATALLRLAWLSHHQGDRRVAAGLYSAALEEAGDDPRLRAELHQGLAWCLYLMREDMRSAARHARTAVELWERLADPVLLADALAVQAQSEFFMSGELPSAPMERALEVAAGVHAVRVLHQPLQHSAVLLMSADALSEARARLEEVRERALAQGDESALPWTLMRLSHVDLLAGSWPRALELADSAYELALQAGLLPLQADLLCTRALVHAHLGNEVEARSAAAEGLASAGTLGAGIALRLGPWALGLLELSTGDPAAARARLEPLWKASEAAGIAEPGENRYLGDLVESLIELGELEDAEALTGRLAQRAGKLDRTSALATAERCRGLLHGAGGDLTAAEGALGRALDTQPLVFERARTRLALGRVQRRLKQRALARHTLTEARDTFDRLGASLYSARAAAELARIGGRAPSGGLTASERTMADLVAEGRSNKEVAAALFITPKTVETKLTRIYAKLDVRSRTELTRLLVGERKL